MQIACLLVMSLGAMHGQSMDCSNNKDIQSKAARYPDGSIAVLQVHSEDDHGKNSHECEADYSLVIKPVGGQEAKRDRFFVSIGGWGRRLSAHLDGFTQDGKHVFGVISEGGAYSFATVFEYDRAGSHVEVQIKQGLPYLKAAKCGTSFAVAGTTGSGEIVLEPNTPNPCREDHRWLLDKSGTLESLKQNAPYLRLYNPGSL